MKQFIQRYGWVILLVVALAIGFLIRGSFYTPDTTGETLLRNENVALQSRHVQDSVAYQEAIDSIESLARYYDWKIKSARLALKDVQGKYVIERDRIRRLSTTQDVDMWNGRTGDSAVIVTTRGDTTISITRMGIKKAVLLFSDLDQAHAIIQQQYSIISYGDSSRQAMNDMLNIKDLRIVTLSREYHQQQRIISDYQGITDQYRKQIRKRNWIIAGVGALAVGGIVMVAVLK